jgi:hypothetical protein
MRATKRLLLLLGASAAALALGATDAGAGGSPGNPIDEVPALSEYVEDIPTAKGKKKATSAKPSSSNQENGDPNEAAGQTRSLPRSVETQVTEEGGSLAPKLRKIATSSDYGAEKRPAKRERDRVRHALEERPKARAPAALGSAVTAGFSGGNTRMSVLLVTLLVATSAAAAAAGFRKRPRGRE